MHAGLHNMWKVYRGRKKAAPNNEVSVFMFDKKQGKTKMAKITPQHYEVLKNDAVNLTKFRHPSLLNLVEAPLEDKTVIAFISEPIDFNLAALAMDHTLRDRIPSEVDLKCMVLELMECINFLHANAKTIHMNLCPENIYVTREGKLKVGGLNFIQPFTTAEPIQIHMDFPSRIREFSLVPNLRFGSPELTASA